jgi:hypothetical protein|tara:strand:- start:426 stop:803 length:378 start_codon:yes stop_codon:yes gene_type:complete
MASLNTSVQLTASGVFGTQNLTINVDPTFDVNGEQKIATVLQVGSGTQSLSINDVDKAYVYVRNIQTNSGEKINIKDNASTTFMTLDANEWAFFPYEVSGGGALKANTNASNATKFELELFLMQT